MRVNDVNDTLSNESVAWAAYWQNVDAISHGKLAFSLRGICKNELSIHSPANMYDMPAVDVCAFRNSVSSYGKVSKGADHWLASDLSRLPDALLQPLNLVRRQAQTVLQLLVLTAQLVNLLE